MEHPSDVFVSDSSGPGEYFAVFEGTDGTEEDTPRGGYLYVSDRKHDRILEHLEIYKNPALAIKNEDVRIFWSSDGTKCGVAVWGRMRGIIDIPNGRRMAAILESRDSPAITDPEWLRGFETYLDQNQFIRVRRRLWQDVAKRYEPNSQPRSKDDAPVETNFIIYEKAPVSLFAVFEDDGCSGYLYMYDPKQQVILEHVHIYDRSDKVKVAASDVEVAWSEDGTKCGVIVWNKMRGIIDRERSRPGRIWMETRDTPGIADKEWLKGFDYLRS